MSDLYTLTANEASRMLQAGEISAVELTEAYIKRIDETEPSVQAFITRTTELAIKQADQVDRQRQAGDSLSPLAGIPIALKDNLCTEGVLTTAASRILHNFVPPYSATVVNRLADAGAVFVGKANCDEFAMGSSTENSAYHVTNNPWDLSRVPGGSSGGSAAAVAACQVPLSLGSDTGGSIRQPASYCGIVGLKPTYGRVSRFGLIAYASSLDQIGPFSRDITDCALLLQAIAGHDPHDSTCLDVPVSDYLSAVRHPDIRGMKVGIPEEYFGQGVASEVASAVLAVARELEAQGAVVEHCHLPSTGYALAAYYVIAPAECSSNLARFDGVKYGLRSTELAGHIGLSEKTRGEGFGAEVKQRIMIGTYVLSAGYYDAYYRRAQQVRTLIRNEFDQAFEKYDILLTPTAPTPAFRTGEKSDPMQMKLADVCTIPVNMAGLPGISIPCGFVDGMPVGVQFIGKAFDEATLLKTAASYQLATNWHKRIASIPG